jgi:hypothetical protein
MVDPTGYPLRVDAVYCSGKCRTRAYFDRKVVRLPGVSKVGVTPTKRTKASPGGQT